MQVGSIIKSLDFPGMSEHYMIGTVVAVYDRDQTIRCEVIKVVRDGKVVKNPKVDFFTTQTEGNHFLDASFPGRLTILD